MIKKRIFMLAALITITLFTVSCKKSNGGGFIESNVEGGNGKATFGFQMKCENVLHDSGEFVGKISGNVQFKDHPAGVKVHGVLDFTPYDVSTDFTSCEAMATLIDDELGPDIDISGAVGTYSNNAGQTGEIVLAVATGPVEPSCSSGKLLLIELSGDISYTNQGCLEGGNLTIF